MLPALMFNPFLLSALWAILLGAIPAGVIGSFVVVKRISFIAGSIAHCILGGMGLCLFLQRTYGLAWISPTLGAFVFALISAWVLGFVHLHYRQREDAVIASIWSSGMAIGMIFISLTPGSNVELLDYLFGNILWVGGKDFLSLAALNLFLLAALRIYYKKFLSVCFDPNQAQLQGICSQKIYLFLLSLIAISIVLMMKIMGTILVIAILTIPATIASLFSCRLWVIMLIASGLSATFGTIGLFSSYFLNLPTAPMIALTCISFYFLALIQQKNRKKVKEQRVNP